jgi:hypothetical protein
MIPAKRKLVVGLPDDDWKPALARIAKRAGMSVSQFVSYRLWSEVKEELRDGQHED